MPHWVYGVNVEISNLIQNGLKIILRCILDNFEQLFSIRNSFRHQIEQSKFGGGKYEAGLGNFQTAIFQCFRAPRGLRFWLPA